MNDLKFAFRQLLRNPGFTAVAVLTLALAIGTGTSVFSLFNAILLRSLPVPNPHQLRVLQWSGIDTRVPSLFGQFVDDGNRRTAECVSPAIFLNLRERSANVADIFAFAAVEDFAVGVKGGTFTANGMTVSDNFFSGLGVRPFIGRVFATGDIGVDAAQSLVRVLVVTQISLSLLLLSGAALYVRTVVNLNHVDVGFNMDKLLIFQLRPADTGYRDARLVEFYERVQNSLAALPGVRRVVEMKS